MTCEIPSEQNRDEQLQLLAAASTFYGRAKIVAGVQFLLLVPAGFLASVIILSRPDWKVWAICYALTVALLDVLALDRIQNYYRKMGARVQEVFDTVLFQLEWKTFRASKPDGEDIARAASSCGNRNSLRDWYPTVVGELSLPMARLICQRAACKWDTDLRRSFSLCALAALAIVIVGVVCISVGKEVRADEMILRIYAPIAPAVLWCVREFLRHREALHGLEKLKGHIEKAWEDSHSADISERKLNGTARDIQDCLFEGRSRHPLIFNWYYRLARRFQEDGMKAKAMQMVKEAKTKITGAKK